MSTKRILLTENNHQNRQMFDDYLVGCGYQVFSLAGGSGFFQTLANFQPHLILLDLKLPDVDGYTLLQQIKQESNGQHVPVIILCGLAFKADQERALSLGARRYLLKPVFPNELRQVIQDELLEKENNSC